MQGVYQIFLLDRSLSLNTFAAALSGVNSLYWVLSNNNCLEMSCLFCPSLKTLLLNQLSSALDMHCSASLVAFLIAANTPSISVRKSWLYSHHDVHSGGILHVFSVIGVTCLGRAFEVGSWHVFIINEPFSCPRLVTFFSIFFCSTPILSSCDTFLRWLGLFRYY